MKIISKGSFRAVLGVLSVLICLIITKVSYDGLVKRNQSLEIESTSDKYKILELNFFKQESVKQIKPSNLSLLKVVADTDKLPRLIWDGKTVMLYANKPFLEMTGYKLEDLENKPFFNIDGTSDFIVKESLKESKQVVEDNANNGVKMVRGTVNQWYKKDGTRITIKWLIGFNDHVTGLGSCQCLQVY